MNKNTFTVCLQLFAKSPEPGFVKTRIGKFIGATRALALHRALLLRSLDQLGKAKVDARELWLTSAHCDAELLQASGTYVYRQQQGADLGQRMARGMTQGLACYDHVIIVGSDCPDLDADYIHLAEAELTTGADVVIGPAMDGGYVLLGMSRFHAEVFEGIPWGSDKVLQITRERLARKGSAVSLLNPLQDIDRIGDLGRLHEAFPSIKF